MLYVVLALVLAAFGLLIAALTTAATLWAWLSVVVSVVAAGLLVHDWWKGRRAKAGATSAEEPRATVATPEQYDDHAVADEDLAGEEPAEPVHAGPAGPLAPEPPPESPAGPFAGLPSEPPGLPAGPPAMAQVPETTDAIEAPDTGEPGEEHTDATDLLIVSELDVEVRVVDEHPRYHLVTCSWLVRHDTIPIAVSEARELGFTPCARCGPDARLAAHHRAAR